jgi:predicted O-methyltransferase YrrM
VSKEDRSGQFLPSRSCGSRRAARIRSIDPVGTGDLENRSPDPNFRAIDQIMLAHLLPAVARSRASLQNTISFGIHVKDWAAKLLGVPDLVRMGHLQRVEDANLGLGWIYYGLTRVIRPQTIVVIGSYRGFTPLVFAKALADNLEGGNVLFIDPSFVDDFWKSPQAVREHFARFGATNIEHFLMTTQQFAQSEVYRSLDKIGIVFVDGYHSKEQARLDYEVFEQLLEPNGVMLFHDSARCGISRIYGPERVYECRVKSYKYEFKRDPYLQVIYNPIPELVTLDRKLDTSEP